MGLLTDPSPEQGRLTKYLLKFHTLLSKLLYIAGVLSFCVIAYPSMNSSTYFSENALLPGLVKSLFREDKIADSYLRELNDEMVKYPDSMPYPWLLAKFQQIGLDTYTHNFTLNSPLKSYEKYTGQNVYGILRAPRSSSTEALVLSVPYRPSSSAFPTTAPSIAIMLAFAKYANKENYWAKDIIFLITEHEQLGAQAWLEAYHGVTCGNEGTLEHGTLRGRAGAIQAAVNLELHSDVIGKMDIKIEGLNGQLPNLDLFNLASKMCIKEGLEHTFKGRVSRHYEYVDDIWLYDFKTLMKMFFTQATGIPNGNHGLFHRFGIQALTLEGKKATKYQKSKVGFIVIGRILEGMFRSLNNLLERFHQSFFFYLLPSSERYISIGLYMPSVCLIAAALIIRACAKWCKLQEKPISDSQGNLVTNNKVTKANISYVLGVFLLSHLIGVLLKSAPPYLIKLGEIYNQKTVPFLTLSLVGLCVMGMLPIFTSFYQNQSSMEVLNIFALLELGTTIICLAMNNFSLGMFCAVLWTPLAMSIYPSPRFLVRFLQKFFWLLLHPVIVVTGIVFINTFIYFSKEKFRDNIDRGFDATAQAVVYSIVDSMVYGNWMYTVITSILIPNWICFFCVTFGFKKEKVDEDIGVEKKTN